MKVGLIDLDSLARRKTTFPNLPLMKLSAFHNPKQDLTEYFKQFKALSGIDYRKLGVYVLTNFNSTLEEDLHRIYTLRALGYSPYVMIYNKARAP